MIDSGKTKRIGNMKLMSKCDEAADNGKEAIKLQSNYCCECKEGSLIGEKVYCIIDLRQHPKYDECKCESFVPKNCKSIESNRSYKT